VQTVFIKFAGEPDRLRGFFALATLAWISSLPGEVYQVPLEGLRHLEDLHVAYRRARDEEVKAAREQARV
jgi:hypothetical protein